MHSKFQSRQAEGQEVYIFRVDGELSHHIGNLEPERDHCARVTQICFLDDDL